MKVNYAMMRCNLVECGIGREVDEWVGIGWARDTSSDWAGRVEVDLERWEGRVGGVSEGEGGEDTAGV